MGDISDEKTANFCNTPTPEKSDLDIMPPKDKTKVTKKELKNQDVTFAEESDFQ